MRFAFLIAVPALPLLAPAAAAGECSACEGRGEIPCQKHKPPEAFEMKHSAWLSFECCLGAGSKPCVKCGSGDFSEKFAKRRDELSAWLADLREGVDGPLCDALPALRQLCASGALR